MSDELRRLLDDRERSRLHSVLEAGLRDGPSRGQLARAARGLGVGAAGLGAAQSAAAQSARTLHASVWTSLAKWGAAGLLLGGAALSPLVLSAPPRAASVPQPSPHRVSAAAPPSLHELPPAPVPPAVPASPAERLVPRVTSAANVAPPPPVVAPAAAIAKGPPPAAFNRSRPAPHQRLGPRARPIWMLK